MPGICCCDVNVGLVAILPLGAKCRNFDVEVVGPDLPQSGGFGRRNPRA
jgi:hypothetical protein